MRLVVPGCVLALGCGRLDFDAITATTDSGTRDASALQTPCRSATSVPANVLVSGQTFRYTDFNNNTSPLPFSGATAFELDRTTVIANTITFMDGGYALSLPTNGAPIPAVLAYSLEGYWTTWIHSDRLYDVDIAGPNMMRWRLGDGPLWDGSAMASIYSTLSATIDPAKAMLSVTVRDCDGSIIEGVTFDIDPPPAVGGYLNSSGLPGINTSTLAPYTQYVAFNVEPTRTRIRGVKAGLQFIDLEIDVQAGDNANYIVVHPL